MMKIAAWFLSVALGGVVCLAGPGCDNCAPGGQRHSASRSPHWIDREGKTVGGQPLTLRAGPEKAEDKLRSFEGSPVTGVGEFSEGRTAVWVGDADARRVGFVDESGAWVVRPEFPDALHYTEGLAAVLFPGTSNVTALNEYSKTPYSVSGDLWGYIDCQGNTTIAPAFTCAEPFADGLAPASGVDKKTGIFRTGLIDKTGSFVVWSPDWVSIGVQSEGLIPVSQKVGWWFLKREKWGYIDRMGNLQLKSEYDYARSFTEGLAAVMRGGRWGYIDIGGNVVIQYQYRTAFPFHDGVAMVEE